jgi:hypothetical protein
MREIQSLHRQVRSFSLASGEWVWQQLNGYDCLNRPPLRRTCVPGDDFDLCGQCLEQTTGAQTGVTLREIHPRAHLAAMLAIPDTVAFEASSLWTKKRLDIVAVHSPVTVADIAWREATANCGCSFQKGYRKTSKSVGDYARGWTCDALGCSHGGGPSEPRYHCTRCTTDMCRACGSTGKHLVTAAAPVRPVVRRGGGTGRKRNAKMFLEINGRSGFDLVAPPEQLWAAVLPARATVAKASRPSSRTLVLCETSPVRSFPTNACFVV